MLIYTVRDGREKNTTYMGLGLEKGVGFWSSWGQGIQSNWGGGSELQKTILRVRKWSPSMFFRRDADRLESLLPLGDELCFLTVSLLQDEPRGPLCLQGLCT